MINISLVYFDAVNGYKLKKSKKVQPVNKTKIVYDGKHQFNQQSNSGSSTFQEILEQKMKKL